MNVENFIAVLLAIVAIAGNPTLAQDKTLDTEDGYRFERFDTATQNFDQAKENCERRGIPLIREGWVVRIKDDVIQNHVDKITSGSSEDYYIGLQLQGSEWYWTDGTILTVGNWAKDEGDDTNENCAFVRGSSGEWFDISCTSPKPFICQSDLIYIEAHEAEISVLEGYSVELVASFATQQDPVDANLYKVPNMEIPLKSATTTKNIIKDITYMISNVKASSDSGEYVFVVTTQDENATYKRIAITRVNIHVPVHITEVTPTSIRSPVTTGPDHVNCTAEGTPIPMVNWKRSETNEFVTSHKTTFGVYQTTYGSTAILHVESAALSDHGMYTCEAINYVTSQVLQKQDNENITLSVLGPPQNFSHNGNKCGETSSITVTWKPNEHSRKSDHRVKVITTTSVAGSVVATALINPHGQDTITTCISEGLDEQTIYSVVITVCPDLCIEYLNDTVDVATAGGLPNPVANNKVTQENSACVISWEWTDSDTYSDEISFVIRETTSLLSHPTANEMHSVIFNGEDCNDNKLECNGRFYQTTKTTEPNRNYTYTVASMTCFGESKEVAAIGGCVTDYSGPDEIATAASLQQTDGFQPILITVSNETNGPISCIFVVIVAGINPTHTTEFTEDTLEDLSRAATNGVSQNAEYLAVAIQRSSVNESGLVINLGDGQTTSCNPKDITGERMINYIAINWELQNGVTHTYYTLTTTPYWTKEGLAFQRSDSNSFVVFNNLDEAV